MTEEHRSVETMLNEEKDAVARDAADLRRDLSKAVDAARRVRPCGNSIGRAPEDANGPAEYVED